MAGGNNNNMYGGSTMNSYGSFGGGGMGGFGGGPNTYGSPSFGGAGGWAGGFGGGLTGTGTYMPNYNQSPWMQRPYERNNSPEIPGSSWGNPTARPEFSGRGPFNRMAYGQSQFGLQQNPYGPSYQQSPRWGGGGKGGQQHPGFGGMSEQWGRGTTSLWRGGDEGMGEVNSMGSQRYGANAGNAAQQLGLQRYRNSWSPGWQTPSPYQYRAHHG